MERHLSLIWRQGTFGRLSCHVQAHKTDILAMNTLTNRAEQGEPFKIDCGQAASWFQS